jgi:hypothetical protein
MVVYDDAGPGSTVQYIHDQTVQYRTVPYSTEQYRTVPYSTSHDQPVQCRGGQAVQAMQ